MQELQAQRFVHQYISKKTTKYKISSKGKQRLSGVILIISSLVSMAISNDGTAAIFLISMGIWLLASKEQLMKFY